MISSSSEIRVSSRNFILGGEAHGSHGLTATARGSRVDFILLIITIGNILGGGGGVGSVLGGS